MTTITTISRAVAACAAVALATGAAACGDEEAGAARGTRAGDVAAKPDAVHEAWRALGLTVTAFEPVDGAAFGGGECAAGRVDGVDAVLCLYASPELAQAAAPRGLEAVGAATGASLAEGRMLLVMVDRGRADPQGRTIQKATRAFRGR